MRNKKSEAPICYDWWVSPSIASDSCQEGDPEAKHEVLTHARNLAIAGTEYWFVVRSDVYRGQVVGYRDEFSLEDCDQIRKWTVSDFGAYIYFHLFRPREYTC